MQVDRPAVMEMTALSVAYLAGLQVSIYVDLDAFSEMWGLAYQFPAANVAESSFKPAKGMAAGY